MAEGRTHYNTLGHDVGKVVRIIFKMLTDNVEFNLDWEVYNWIAAITVLVKKICISGVLLT